jgi:MFS family permease
MDNKPETLKLDKARSNDSTGNDVKVELVSTFDQQQTKRLLRKIDWHLIPFLSLLYLLSFLDRTNIGNAKIFGLEDSLSMPKSSDQYNIALCVFFITYVLFEVPSNMILKRWRASMWFPIMMLAWGVVMTLTGLVTNFEGLVVARVFLGIAESGLFPGVNYYITLWYCRRECAFRAAIFFSAATVAGAFGGLLARGINEMGGVGGRPGWAWIFILEGLLTIVVAIIAFWALADSPQTASFLTEEESKEVQYRLANDNDDLSHHFDKKFMFHAFADWKIWMQSIAYLGILTPLYSFSLFLPSIIAAMGFSAATSQLLTVPPYVLGCICTVLGGYFSDKTGKRGLFLVCFCCMAIVGYILLISTDVPAAQYIGTFLAACGVYPMIPIMVMWNGNNIGGSTKRGVGIAMQIGFGNCGGVIASFIYRNVDAPRYFLGHGTILGFLILSLIFIILQMIILTRINKKRDEKYGPPENYTADLRRAEMDEGDKASFFRYSV